ncbi:hypothetical protein BBJ29_003160 [Phytophthora kernoviae]|uniref:DUF7726 domain-containing protein n=1 Tax=Phytophthora kernoviae TaxID=325452 RepID=A0A3R7K7V4_9STRA|nr:hypothetical protein BBJ29_003160 [Phytophthora kernoviae]
MKASDKKRKATEQRTEVQGWNRASQAVFLGEKLTTQAAFLRTLGNINTNSLRSFMNLKRGAGSGASNVVYRKAYVFFEKKRILEGKKKTKKRQDHEAKQGSKGFSLRHDSGMRWVFVGKGF